MYKTIIFDLGNVIYETSFDRVFSYWADASGKSFDEIKSKFRYDDTFNAFERDEISPGQFRARVSEQLGIELPEEEFDKGWCNLYMNVYDGIDELLNKLKMNYRVVAFTNTNRIHQKAWTVKYAPVLMHFERIFISNEMKVRKPEQRAYKMVLDQLHSNPSETLFLDDNEDNVKGALGSGIRSILVSSPKAMIGELVKAGIL